MNTEILKLLSPENLLAAYCQGLFPMIEDDRLYWFSPDPRGLLPLDERFHVSRSLERTLRRGKFVCTVNHAFDAVVVACADRGDDGGTWISPEIRAAYRRLHELGLAHSVEAWPADAVGQGAPVGGLYGLALAGAFFAESMFHTQTDAGKAAVVVLIERLRQRGYRFCDIQWTTDNLKRFGAYDLPRNDYLDLLTGALELECRFD